MNVPELIIEVASRAEASDILNSPLRCSDVTYLVSIGDLNYELPAGYNNVPDTLRLLIAQARRAPGCRDLVVAADPLELERVNVYEEWESEQDLLKFRGRRLVVLRRQRQRLQT